MVLCVARCPPVVGYSQRTQPVTRVAAKTARQTALVQGRGNMLAKGTIVIYIEKGSFQEAYCVGERRPFIIYDFDDDAEDIKHIREATTAPTVPEDILEDIEEERKKKAANEIDILKTHLRRLTSLPMTTVHLAAWVCNYCNIRISLAKGSPKDIENHMDDCIWALAKKALENDDG